MLPITCVLCISCVMCHLLRFGAFRVGLFCLFCCIARANIKLYRFLFCFLVYCAPISLFHILETCKSTGCKTIIKKLLKTWLPCSSPFGNIKIAYKKLIKCILIILFSTKHVTSFPLATHNIQSIRVVTRGPKCYIVLGRLNNMWKLDASTARKQSYPWLLDITWNNMQPPFKKFIFGLDCQNEVNFNFKILSLAQKDRTARLSLG